MATVVFGVVPIVAPRSFSRLFGLPYENQRGGASMPIRSVGWRDLITGLGLLLDRRNGRTWLWLRFSYDLGDLAWSVLGLPKDRRNYGLMALASVAGGASLVDVVLLVLSRKRGR